MFFCTTVPLSLSLSLSLGLLVSFPFTAVASVVYANSLSYSAPSFFVHPAVPTRRSTLLHIQHVARRTASKSDSCVESCFSSNRIGGWQERGGGRGRRDGELETTSQRNAYGRMKVSRERLGETDTARLSQPRFHFFSFSFLSFCSIFLLHGFFCFARSLE